MKNIKRISALVLALVMVLAMSVTAFADGEATLTGGEVGGFTNPDTPTSQNKTIILKKELTAYNVDGVAVKAPTITYTYAITAGAAGLNVTDATSDHTSGVAVTTPTLAGAHPESVTITGTSANTIAWTNADELTTDTAGSANTKDLKIDFSNVVFSTPGVYRYVITETPAVGSSYAATGVTETTDSTNGHVRYLDVYVRANPSGVTSNGTIAADWDIYGYVCMYDSEAITPDGDTTILGAMKTNGFVSGTNDGTEIKADSYYTYNLTVSKSVTNDTYGAATHAYPFTVIFTNATIDQSIDIIGSSVAAYTTGTAGGFTEPAAAALSTGTTKGILTLKDSSSQKYVGIPMGTSVEVYETNDVTGVTYLVTTVTDGTTPGTVDNAVTWGTAPTEATAQAATKEAYQSTKATITTSAGTDDDTSHTIAINNNLQIISPTGVALRIAPYAIMLFVGIALFVITRRRENTEEA